MAQRLGPGRGQKQKARDDFWKTSPGLPRETAGLLRGWFNSPRGKKLLALAEGEAPVSPLIGEANPVGFPTGQVGWN